MARTWDQLSSHEYPRVSKDGHFCISIGKSCIYVSICILNVQWVYGICMQIRTPASDNQTSAKQITNFVSVILSINLL